MSWIVWVALALTWVLIIGDVIARRPTDRAMRQVMQEAARADLDLMTDLRRTLEDLRRISPEIEETVSLSIAEIDARRPALEALADGRRWAAVRATYTRRRKQ